VDIRRMFEAMNTATAGWYELEQERQAGLQGLALLAAAIIAVIYVAIVAAVAGATGAFYIMFPELGALAYDVFGRPRGHWARAPGHLAATPIITGAIGILITRGLPYGFISVLLNVGGALAVLLGLGSPIAPAISAGLLPLVLGVKSWGYPPGIMFGTALLALLSLAWRGLMGGHENDRLTTSAPSIPRGFFWAVAYFAFLIAAVAMVKLTGLRFILFPPLAVIGFEMFGHVESCAWAGQPFRLPIVCCLTASGGLLFHHLLGVTWMTAALSMALGIAVLRLMRVHVPPALAVALLPMVMNAPTIWYPISVGLGTVTLTLWFWYCRDRIQLDQGIAASGSLKSGSDAVL
jgi:hypothetical protein